MAKISFTGGARIGNANASWPFATLTVSESTLHLSLVVCGDYNF